MADLERLDKSIKELELQSTSLKEFSSVYSELNKLKNDIQKNLVLLSENNTDLSKISKEVTKQLTDTEKQIDELFSDNKAFQKELDGSLSTRLEKHKSDIQLEIRNEMNHTLRSLETTIRSQVDQIQRKVIEKLEHQHKKIVSLQTLMYIAIGLSTVLSVLTFIM